MGLYDETVKVGRRTMVLFFIIDTSGSMRGAKIGQVNAAIEGILPKIKEISKENADAEIKVCVLNFATKAKWVTAAPVSVEDEAYRWEYVEAGGTTALGDACRKLNEALSTKTFMKEVSGSYAPVLFLMSDGEPTDDYRSGIEVLKHNNWFKAAIKVAIGIGNDANKSMLAESVIEVHTPEELKKWIQFVTVTSSQIGSSSTDTSGKNKNEQTGNEINKEKKKSGPEASTGTEATAEADTEANTETKAAAGASTRTRTKAAAGTRSKWK